MVRVPTDVLTFEAIAAPEEEFLSRVRRGDLEALGEVYDQHHQALCSFATRLLGDDHAAEDLVQDVFVVLPGVIAKLRPESSLRGFLLGIAANRAKHQLRSRSRRRKFAERFGHEPVAKVEDPERLRERRGLAEALGRALEELPVDQRVTFVLKEIEGYSCRDASEILGIPEATVRTRVFHAKQRLRAFLAELGVS
jgi:RNA polymerase sigma-70 factor (ECF subfamily)